MTTIDLGELSQSRVDLPAGSLPVSWRRTLLAGVVTLACLLAVGGSARSDRGFTDPLWEAEVSLVGYSLGSGSVYLAEPDAKTVLARDLHTGRVRWQLPLTEMPLFTTEVGPGTAAVVTHVPVPGGQEIDTTFALVDEATGQVRVRTGGSTDTLTTGPGYLLATAVRDPTCEDASRGGCMDVFALDVATGAEMWRLSFSPYSYYLRSETAGRVDSFAEVSADGRVRLRSAVTGAVIEEAVFPDEQDSLQVVLLPDRLLTAVRLEGRIQLTAYRRGPLTPTWSVMVPMVGNVNRYEGFVYVSECGRVVCVHFDGGGTRLVYVDTGALGPMLPAEMVSHLGGGLLVGTAMQSQEIRRSDQVRIINPADGRTIAFLSPQSELVGWRDGGGRLLVAEPGTARTGFALLDATGVLRRIGSVPGIGLTCQASVDVLACADGGGHLRVWRLPALGPTFAA